MPAAGSTPPAAEPDGSSKGPVTGPGPQQPAKGSEVRVMRCPIHGIAYDSEREVCPECAKGVQPRKESATEDRRAEMTRRDRGRGPALWRAGAVTMSSRATRCRRRR